MKYNNLEFKLENGDILILYTDGLIEIRNKQGEFFDIKGIIDILNKNKNKNIDELAIDIEKTVNDFGKYSPNKDDQAMIIIKYKK